MESQGRLINVYAEPLGQSGKHKRVRVPGLTSQFTSSAAAFNCMAWMGSKQPIDPDQRLWVSLGNNLYYTDASAGALTLFEAGTGAVACFAENSRRPDPDMLLIANGQVRLIDLLNTETILISGGEADIPSTGMTSVCMIDGYFVFTHSSARWYASGLNITGVDALSFAFTDTKPDGLVRAIAYSGRLLMYGRQTTEVWQNVGATPFPFQRAAVIPFGLLDFRAVAGWEDGFGSGLCWVADDYTVRLLDGYAATRVSTPDLERKIAQLGFDLGTNTNFGLDAMVYVVDGHPMWCLTGTSGVDPSRNFTWCLDLSTRLWHERASHLSDVWRGKGGIFFTPNNTWICGDRNTTGTIFTIDPTNHTENGDPLRARVESAAVSEFPARTRVLRADFELETGVGITGGEIPIETDPTMQISWSDDGGVTWGNPLTRALGQQAQYRDVSVYNVGRTTRYGRRWRLDVADPIYVNFVGGDQSHEPRR